MKSNFEWFVEQDHWSKVDSTGYTVGVRVKDTRYEVTDNSWYKAVHELRKKVER